MKKKNTITGIVVIVALVLLFFGFNFLNSNNLFVRGNIYYALYDKVDGLEKSSIVMIRGYKVGTVVDVAFKDESARQLVVAFTVKYDYQIPKNTEARIVDKDIMGSRALSLIFPSKIDGYLQPEDTLRSSLAKGLKEEVSAEILPLKAKVENLMSSMDTVLNSARSILGMESQQNLIASMESMKETFQNLQKTTTSLDDIVNSEKENIKNMLANFSSIAENLDNNKKNVNKILTNISSITDTLVRADFVNTISETKNVMGEFSQIMKQVNSGKGTLGALMKDKSLYHKMENTASSLDRLLTDVRLNPKKYVSFSLLQTGRKVYYETDAKSSNGKNKYYRILVLTTREVLSTTNKVFRGHSDIEKRKVEGKYLYTIGYTKDYKALEKQLEKVRNDFPDAYIVED